MAPFKKFRFLLGVLGLYASLWACTEKEFDPNDPEKSFGIAKEPYDDESYDLAIGKLGEFKARFPYSRFATEAELLIADCHYELGQYAEAAGGYEQFAKLHPKHARVDYARFRTGESYWAEAPDAVNRDPELTVKALKAWDELIREHPQSPYSSKAQGLVREGKARVSGNSEFIADFYCRMDHHASCARRMLDLLERFGPENPKLAKKASDRAARALHQLAEDLEADPKSDKNLFFRDMSPKELRDKAASLVQGRH